MCNDIKICIRRLCIAIFAIIGILMIFAGIGTMEDDNVNKNVVYILCAIGGGFIVISICICKCCPLIAVTSNGDAYEYTGC